MIQKLQSKAINQLRSNGVKKKLWLVEVQTIEAAAALYGDYIKTDHTAYKPDEHDSIIYYHQNGAINHYATFNQHDQKSFEKAIVEIENYLKN